MPEVSKPDSPAATTLVPICAIGASAGGVAALRDFFGRVRNDLNLAYVVVVHLSPDHPSALSEILGSATTMPVQQVDDAPLLVANCVYVIPPDREIVISGNGIAARPFTQPRGRRAPIDMFFRSIAAARGDGCAIVLSGSGSDGSLGVRAVKEAGGIVFVQEPTEAEYAMMPQNAIATGVADFVAPIAALTARLAEVAHSKEAIRSLSFDGAGNDLRRILNFMRARTGHDFSSYKRATVMRRIARRMQVTRRQTLADYADHVRDTPEEAKELFADLLISVTMFFRDAPAFQALTEQIMQRVFGEADSENSIRVWVVGCATGEEAYSIAMLLLEETAQRKVTVPIQIFATDLDEGALATAREGRYPNSIEADVSEERLRRWFTAEGTHYRVRKEVRDTVLFATHSVLKDPPFMRLDLISCRNLLIYLERALQRQLGTVFHYSLKPNRYLFLGSAETIDAAPELFASVDRESRIYLARPQRNRVLPQLPPFPDHRTEPPSDRRRISSREEHDKGGATVMHVAALERHHPPSVLVDDAQRIVNLSATAGRFIQHSGGPFAADLSAIVRPELRLDLKLAIERAISTREPTLTLPTLVAFDSTKRRVSLHVMPIALDESSALQVLIFFLDGGVVEVGGITDEAELAAKPDETRRLHEELKLAHERLSASRQDHETAIQDLRAANEELQSINEEYRSTAEELETSKEELQSINEELQTVNAELKSKLESISSAHNDLQNLTAATEIGTLFLDPELKIRMFTAPVAELFNIRDGDVGRAITNFTHRMTYESIELDAKRVLRDLAPFETVVRTRERSYMMRIRPYRTVDDRIEGLVITFVEITARVAAEQQLHESEERYRMLFNSIDEGFCIVEMILDERARAVDYRFLEVNSAFGRQTGLTNAVGKTMRSLAPQHEAYWYEVYGRVATTRQAERFEHRAAALQRFYEVYAFPVGSPDERRVGVLFMDVSKRKESEAHLKLMVDELNHRVKNTLTVVQAIAQQTFKHGKSPAEARVAFEGRLASLATAHNLLTRSHWERAALKDVVRAVVGSCNGEDGRFVIRGPEVHLAAQEAVSFSMAIHELCVNATKYGALSTEHGRVEITWEVAFESRPRLKLEWRELGGPVVVPPIRRGFGSLMVEQALAHELDGLTQIDYDPNGVVCKIEARLRMPVSLP